MSSESDAHEGDHDDGRSIRRLNLYALRTALIGIGIYMILLGWFTYQGFKSDREQDEQRCRVTLLGRAGSEAKDREIFEGMARRFGADSPEELNDIFTIIEESYEHLPEPADC